MIKKLLSYVRQYKKVTIITPFLTAGEVLIDVLIPVVIGILIDRGVNAGSMRGVLLYGAIMIVMSVFGLLFGILGARTAATASTGFATNLRQAVFEKIQDFSFTNIDHFSTAGLVTRMTTDITNIQNAFQMMLRIAVRSPLMLIGSLIMAFMINVKLSLIFLVAVIVLGCGLMIVMRLTMPIFRQVFNKYDDLNGSVQENVTAIRVVKAFVREDFENEKFLKQSKFVRDLSMKAEHILILNNPIMMFAIYFCMLGLSWVGAHFIVAGNFTTGQLTSMFSYVMAILMSLMMLSMVFVMLTMSLTSAGRICQVLDEVSEITNPAEPVMEVADGSIDFNHVNFSYSTVLDSFDDKAGEYVLQDIDLHINAGETIGIIGGTGSGKTSLVNLISRLYDVDEGAVVVGGRDVRDYDIKVIRDAVSVVLQKNVLFSGTILDNLRWGDENATEEECREACEMACADEFIEKLPNGYNTWIEQGGSNVSGGQRQRLTIARALMKKPKVLILDDSTSAVDTATDAKIREAFNAKIPGMTKIIIAQRLSSVESADRILVLHDGKVNAFDTPANLLKSNEIYKDIYKTQMQSGGDFDEPQ